MKVTIHELDKNKNCYKDTPDNRAAGLVKDVEVETVERKIVDKDGVRIAVPVAKK